MSAEEEETFHILSGKKYFMYRDREREEAALCIWEADNWAKKRIDGGSNWM